MEAQLLAGEKTVDSKTVRLGFVAGVIQQEKLIAFERLLFRATRGNMFLKSTAVGSVLDPTSGEKQEKAVFVVFFAGERARTKILKVLIDTNFGACCITADTTMHVQHLCGVMWRYLAYSCMKLINLAL